MDLSHIHRTGPEEAAWSVTLSEDEGGERVLFPDFESGGVLPALLDALHWRSERTGARKDWGWVEEGLERVDRGGTHGWWASVNLGSYLDADLFEDAEHGGTREALLAALAWRRRVARPGGGAPARAAPANGGGGGKGGGRGARRKGEKEKHAAPARAPANGRRTRKRPRRGNPRPPTT